MGMRGADPQQLIDLNRRLTQQATAVTTLKTEIGQAIEGTVWEGPARQNFVHNWQANYAKALDQLAQGLGALGEEVRKRAEALQQIM